MTTQTQSRINDAMPRSDWEQIREEVLGPMKRRDENQVLEKPRIQSGELQIINQEANREDSMRILKKKGLRPITYQEALTTYKEVLIGMARRNSGFLFYLDGQGLDEDGPCTLNAKGELEKGRGAIDDTVDAHPGKLPLYLGVSSDAVASQCGCRFDLYAYVSSYYGTLGVGVRDESVRE